MPENIETNATAVAAELTGVADQIEDPASTLRRVEQILARQEQEVFDTEGGALGGHWAPAVNPESARLLVLTGDLLASVTSEAAGHIEGTELEFGTEVPYGRYLQAGTSNMVARPFLGITQETSGLIDELLAQIISTTGEGEA